MSKNGVGNKKENKQNNNQNNNSSNEEWIDYNSETGEVAYYNRPNAAGDPIRVELGGFAVGAGESKGTTQRGGRKKKTKHRKKKLGRKGKKKKRQQRGGSSNDRHCLNRAEASCKAQEQAAFGCQWDRTDDDGDVYPGCTYNGPAYCEGKKEAKCGVGGERSDKKGCYWDEGEQPAQCNYGGTSSDEESTYEYFSDGENDGDGGHPSQPCQLQVGNEIRHGCTNIRGPECTILPLTSSKQIDQTKYPYKTVTCADSATHLDAPHISNNNLLPEAVLLPESKVLGEGKAFQAKILSEGTEVPLADIGGKRKSKRGRRKAKRRKKRRKTKRRRKSHRKTHRKRKKTRRNRKTRIRRK